MSAIGPKQTSRVAPQMPAFGSKADMAMLFGVAEIVTFRSDKTIFLFPFNTGTNPEFVGMSVEYIEFSDDS
jgi:hypothetical protein